MILKDIGWPYFITYEFINHLEIIHTFIFTFKRTDRNSVDFTIIIGLLSTIDTPTELSTFEIMLVDFINLK